MNTTLRVDVTKQTSQWNRIQIASAFALFFSLETAVSTLFEVIKGGYSTGRTDHTGLFVQIPLFLFSLFMIWQTWKYGSIFNRQSLIKIKYAFMIAATLMLLFSTYLILSFLDDDAERSISQLKQLLYGAMGAGLFFIGCIVVVVAITRLMGSKVDGIGLQVSELLDDGLAKSNEPPPEAYALVRIDQPMGVFWMLLGAVVFIFGAALGSVILEFWVFKLNTEGNPFQILQLHTLVEISGALLILKGRAYFTPKAEAVLAIDRRTPIVYLRSFSDETPDTVHNLTFVDRSLEMKLATYFLPFGPFLAIGSPRDALPKLGALRLIRSNADWQGEILGLMDRSQLLLASVGSSEWIKWELAESLRHGFERKSIFIFPTTIRRGWRVKQRQIAQQAERISTLTASYGLIKTPDYDTLEPNDFLLVQVRAGAQTVLVTTRRPGSNSLMLSVVVGHFLLRRGGQTQALAQ